MKFIKWFIWSLLFTSLYLIPGFILLMLIKNWYEGFIVTYSIFIIIIFIDDKILIPYLKWFDSKIKK